MTYSIVIPTYNNCEKYLKPCIDSIIKYTDMTDVELVISANGCTDNTKSYLEYLITAIPCLKIVWSDEAVGFANAINDALLVATSDKIVLLNNDIILLEQNKNQWLERLDCGDISAVLTQYSEITKRRFAIFFCVMIKKEVFANIGLLNEDYEIGGNEDIEFCLKADEAGFTIMDVGYKGDFPIYHVAEGTVHDTALVQNWKETFLKNELKLAKKYNLNWYKWRLSNNYERAVFLKDDVVFPRETQRYQWAFKNLFGYTALEIGCSTGYGVQFFKDVEYAGLDYDPIIVNVAKEQNWNDDCKFIHADINTIELDQYDTIIAFEVIEHLDNGLEIIEKLKKHCRRLLISVPYKEPKGFWGEHHKLHELDESHFAGFTFEYIDQHGAITNKPAPITEDNICNLMIGQWNE